uniref:CSON010841 protein n=1 Tax=Culicoides sonorensis TaxID=179676 RepID=A0A336M2K7_CULSO
MFKFILIGIAFQSLTVIGGRLDAQYGQNSLCTCGPGQGQGQSSQKSYSYSAPSYSQPQQQPQSQGQQIPILKYENINRGDGSYNFAYETGNGIKHEESSNFQSLGPENGEQVVMGSYSYTDTDGKEVTVNYKADSNGFVATGDHLPTPPPIPPEIQESLKLTAPGYTGYSHSGSGSPSQSSGGYNFQQTQSYNQPQSQKYVPPQRQPQPQKYNPQQPQFGAPQPQHHQSGGSYRQVQHTSTNLIPGGIATQASHSSTFGSPGTAFASQSSFGPGGVQQSAFASQSTFGPGRQGPKNTYLPPY